MVTEFTPRPDFSMLLESLSESRRVLSDNEVSTSRNFGQAHCERMWSASFHDILTVRVAINQHATGTPCWPLTVKEKMNSQRQKLLCFEISLSDSSIVTSVSDTNCLYTNHCIDIKDVRENHLFNESA